MAVYNNYVYGDQNIKVPAHLNFGKYMLDFLRQKKYDDIAFLNADSKKCLTYKDVTQYAVDLAVALQKFGVQKEDMVAVGTEKRITLIPTFIGIIYTGAAYTPYELESGRAVLQHKLEIAKPKYILCSKKFWDLYKDIIDNCASIKAILNLDEDGINNATLISSLMTKHTDPICFEPVAVQGQVDTAVVLYSSGTTGMPKGVQLTHLNCILNTCSFPDEIPNLKLLQGYGMTEAGEPTSERWANFGPKSGSVGKASPGITLKVSDPITNETLGAKQKGEIRIRGPSLMKGYIGVDLSTYLDDEGFLKTGDLGYYDDDHYIFIVDRLKDIINFTGYKVAPMEVEAILLMHPGVKEVGVVGKPDPACLELPAAFVVRQPNLAVTEKELHDFLSIQALPYMQLKGGIKFLPELPKNSRGKVLRNELRKMLLD